MAHLFIFGLGYSAGFVRIAARARGLTVSATGREGELDFADAPSVLERLAQTTHVLSSVPPERATGHDPVLDEYGAALDGKWLGYLSSTGVYGDAGGAWVDESTSVGAGRRAARVACDAAWLARGARVFDRAQSHHRPEIYDGIGAAEAAALLQDFFTRLRR